jgi:predicted peptidase
MSIKLIVGIISCAILLTQSKIAQSVEFEKHIFSTSSGELPYRFVRAAEGSETKYPLLVFLHGGGELGDNNETQLSNFPSHFLSSENRAKYNCYIIAPQCPSYDSWTSFPQYPSSIHTSESPTQAMSLVLSLIDSLCKATNLNIDKNRIYVTGLSLGGEGTFDIITRAPDLFAAAAPICGIADTSKSHLMKNTPLWIFHGSKDDINDVKYSRMIVKALASINVNAKYTEYPNLSHYCWNKAFDEPEFLSWMFSQRKSTAVKPSKRSGKSRSYNTDFLFHKNQSLATLIKQPSDLHNTKIYSLNGKQVSLFVISKCSIPAAKLLILNNGTHSIKSPLF